MDVLASYREASPGLRRVFTLYPDKVVVAGRVVGGADFETHIPLKELSPDFGFLRFRSRRCVAGFMLFAALTVLLWLFLSPFQLPLLSGRVVATTSLAALSLGVALAYMPNFKAYRSVSNHGVVVLDIIEAGPDRCRCREFAERVSEAVREA